MNEITILTTKVHIEPPLKAPFADWQVDFNTTVAAFPGFVSMEILSAVSEWRILQRFSNSEALQAWKKSKVHQELIEKLQRIVGPNAIEETELEASNLEGGVTEVFVTQVAPDMDEAFRKWLAKMHQAEAKFPGFRGVYVQSPSTTAKNWITMLQFDTPENLDRWLTSPERNQVLKESESFIASLESHRVISPYAGWFSSLAKTGLPSVWKQTMVVLLVLFPIVIFEIKYLSPLTSQWGPSLATFIGNALSVTLIAWPMMPIAIRFLRWWLCPVTPRPSITLLGTLVVLALYLIEIAIFWNFI